MTCITLATNKNPHLARNTNNKKDTLYCVSAAQLMRTEINNKKLWLYWKMVKWSIKKNKGHV